jgi:hypothetical protein
MNPAPHPAGTNPNPDKTRPAGPVGLRYATADDTASIVTLIQSAYRGETSRTGWTTETDLLDSPRTDQASVTAAITSTTIRILLTVSPHGQLTGCAQIRRGPDTMAHFRPFAVDPRRQGTGSANNSSKQPNEPPATNGAPTR